MHVGQTISTLVEDGVAYADIDADTTLTLQVPYDGDSASHILVSLRSQCGSVSNNQTQKISVDLSYTTASTPDISRTLRATRTLTTALPFSVNVEDFFRGRRWYFSMPISAFTKLDLQPH